LSGLLETEKYIT
jgi:hypothetical protein